MGRMKWLLPVVITVVVLAVFWWIFRDRTYTARDLMTRDSSTVVLILADMEEKRLVNLKQELVQLRSAGNPTESADIERLYALTSNAIRMRGIDERKHLK
jgi:hypothetical protein